MKLRLNVREHDSKSIKFDLMVGDRQDGQFTYRTTSGPCGVTVSKKNVLQFIKLIGAESVTVDKTTTVPDELVALDILA